MTPLKVGLIGLGKVAESHLAGYKDVDLIEVRAGSDISPDRLKQLTGKWGFNGYTDPKEMLDQESLDMVCIMAPPKAHRELTELAAARGVHVLCEKPMALSLEDCRAMVEACDKAGVMFYYGSSYRCLPACVKAREMIAAGTLGKIVLMLEMYVGGTGPDGWIDLGPHHYPTDGPGGGGMGLVDHGIHFADVMPWLAGSPVQAVWGRGNLSGQAPAAEHLTMMLANGAVGQLLYHEATHPAVMPGEGIFSLGASWNVRGELVDGGDWDGQPQSIHVHGEKGALRIFHYANQLYHFSDGVMKQIPISPRGNPGHFGLQVETFARNIINKEKPLATGEDGLRALEIVLAAYESAEKKAVVPVGG